MKAHFQQAKNAFIFLICLGLLFGALEFKPALAQKSKFFLAALLQEEVKKSETPRPPQEPAQIHILVYHNISASKNDSNNLSRQYFVSPEEFKKQMQYLKDENYSVVSFYDLIDYFNNKPLPPKSVIITFDDGRQNQYENAFPVLKEYGYPATFFVFTNAIDRPNYLTWNELKDLKQNNMTIGSHTKFHPKLFKITDQKELEKEIAESKQILESHLQTKIDFFAYPYGIANNESMEIIKSSDYLLARTLKQSEEKSIYTKDNSFKIDGIIANPNFEKFKASLK